MLNQVVMVGRLVKEPTKEEMVGIKGRLESKNNEIKIKAEKITFLSSRKGSEE